MKMFKIEIKMYLKAVYLLGAAPKKVLVDFQPIQVKKEQMRVSSMVLKVVMYLKQVLRFHNQN